jgi:16S rRNA pseudouridine516 synthase
MRAGAHALPSALGAGRVAPLPRRRSRLRPGGVVPAPSPAARITRAVKGSAGAANFFAANAPPKPERVDRLLSRLGYCTRAEAKRWVSAGRVVANGERVSRHDAKVAPVTTGEVLIDGEVPEAPDRLVAIMRKPLDVVCSHDPREGPSVYDLLPERWRRRNPRVEAIGRLDKDTSGLLLFTDDGDLSHRLTSPRKKVWKTYEVALDADVPEDAAEIFAAGALLLRGEKRPCAPARLTVDAGRRRATLEITEGRFHQVRRMMASVGCVVTRLERSRFGNLDLGALEPGDVRRLDEEELERVFEGAEEG